MPLDVSCPHCGDKNSVPDERLGQHVVCLTCDEPFLAGGAVVPPPPQRLKEKQAAKPKSKAPASAPPTGGPGAKRPPEPPPGPAVPQPAAARPSSRTITMAIGGGVGLILLLSVGLYFGLRGSGANEPPKKPETEPPRDSTAEEVIRGQIAEAKAEEEKLTQDLKTVNEEIERADSARPEHAEIEKKRIEIRTLTGE